MGRAVCPALVIHWKLVVYMKKSLAVYIHIPFCIRKCRYCDFLSAPAHKDTIQKYVEVLCREISRFENASDYIVDTVFLGGGTPSILSGDVVTQIMDTVRLHFDVASDAEVSMECNPGTAEADKLVAYRRAGINRLSIGLQSSRDSELRELGRVHTYEDFDTTFRWAKEASFDNINIDIMSALPGQTLESYLTTLECVLEHRPEHISSYSLIIEEGTPFYDIYGPDACEVSDICRRLPDEDAEREMYYATERRLEEAGYHRYEISNYSLDGYECRHNLVYWSGGEYAGFGLGASSYIGGVRYRNDDNLDSYLKYNGNVIHCDVTKLGTEDRMEEFMFLGLRRIKGVSLTEWARLFGCSVESVYGDVLKGLYEQKLIESYRVDCEEYIRLTRRGIDVSNVVLSEFLLERQES